MLEQARPRTKAAIEEITDVFSGMDGGMAYVSLLTLVEGLDVQAAAGDTAAAEIIAVILKFHKLVQVAQLAPKNRRMAE